MNLIKIASKIPTRVNSELPQTCEKFGINSDLRLAHFLAQCAHESGWFSVFSENLNYSADRLMVVFKKYFPNAVIANQYARKPSMIGSRVYASRMGNGPESSGDGYKFRGRGYIQLTGADNYRQFGLFMGVNLLSNPDLVATQYPLSSAAYFFHINNLWTICDHGATDADVRAVTKRVNGGYNGIDDRINKFQTFYNALTK